ncbi:hypothetical protein ACFLS9_09330, partial [Bacteroidota bacterium]
AIKSFKGDLDFEPNEFGLIEVSVINESPDLSASISNYFVKLADSLHIELNIKRARNNRIFVEKRFNRNLEDLNDAEENFALFQQKYGAFAVPEQVKAAVEAAGALEAQLIESQILVYNLEGTVSENSIIYKKIWNKIKAIEKKLSELSISDNVKDNSSLLIPFDKLPEIQVEYLRKFRDLEIQNRILQFLYPIYEQAKIDEQKSVPTLFVVDKAVPPELKYAPKKSFIILFITFIVFVIHLPFIFRADKLTNVGKLRNPLEEKELGFYNRIIKFYKIKFN